MLSSCCPGDPRCARARPSGAASTGCATHKRIGLSYPGVMGSVVLSRVLHCILSLGVGVLENWIFLAILYVALL